MYFFRERSSFIFRLKNNVLFSGKRNIIFLDDKRKITFQCDFFGKIIFSEHLEKEFMVFRAVKIPLQYAVCSGLSDSHKLVLTVLKTSFDKNKHCQKLLGANHLQYVIKALRKAIVRRSKFEKIYFKKQTNESLKAYKNQKNYCSKLYKKERKKFCDNLNTFVAFDNKTFWKVIKPFFTNKSTFGRNIKLIEKKKF